MDFNTFLYNLNSMGFYNFVLPWILFLMIFYAILSIAPFIEKAKNDGKKIAIVISAILAFFSVNYPLNGIPLGQILSDMFGWTSIYIGGVLVIMLFLGLGGFKLETITGDNKTAIAFILLLVGIIVLGAAGFPLIQLSDTMWTLIFVLVLIGGAVLFLGEEKKGGENPPPKST